MQRPARCRVRRGRGAARRAGAEAPGVVAVRLLRARARRRSRPCQHSAPGSDRRPPMRSTNSSISRSTTSARNAVAAGLRRLACARRRREVKRDMEIARDEVRVMTVHGAKGLEAHDGHSLADTTTRPDGAASAASAQLPIDGARRVHPTLVWACRKRQTMSADGPIARAARLEARARRIPAAALCRDDARRRSADRLRRAGRASGRRAAGTISCERCSLVGRKPAVTTRTAKLASAARGCCGAGRPSPHGAAPAGGASGLAHAERRRPSPPAP